MLGPSSKNFPRVTIAEGARGDLLDGSNDVESCDYIDKFPVRRI